MLRSRPILVLAIGATMGIAALGAYSAFCDGTVPASQTDDLCNIIVLGIGNNYSRVVSGAGQFTIAFASSKDSAFPLSGEGAGDYVNRYEWSFDREKFKEIRSRMVGGLPTNPTTLMFDGQNAIMWKPKEKLAEVRGSISNSVISSAISRQLGLCFVHDDPQTSLYAEIIAAKPLAVSTETFAGQECYRLEGDSRGLHCSWWVASDKGFCVVKSLKTRKSADGDTVMWETVYEGLKSYSEDIWLPTSVAQSLRLQKRDGTTLEGPKQLLTVESLKINCRIEPDSFSVALPADARLITP